MTTASTTVDLPPAPPHLANAPVLRRAKNGLRRIYGKRLAGIILYGSRARGDNRANSDYDLLALIENFDPTQPNHEPALHALMLDLFQMEPDEIEVNIRPMDEHALGQRTGFMFNIRKEGLRL